MTTAYLDNAIPSILRFGRLVHKIGRWCFGSRGPHPRRVRFGNLRRTTPISRNWGQDRGRALDRYYIEKFLDENRADIRGRVLEIGDAHYTRKYGGTRVVSSDVLHVNEGNPQATIIADLTCAEHIPDSSFDCIILTQTLQLIFDVPAALRTIRRILKPGGTILATFPGITHTGDAEWGSSWCWSFTRNSARRLFHPIFGESNVCLDSYGNVLAATAFLYGLADRELEPAELEVHDPAYDVIIAVKAVRPADPL
ncbi:methyltransferase domain-containing protein [Microvirga sp. TS319]|uniref:methyltransferase domain-containing protein n=1 Tax=Microvirga sp. TS319 TaxID=3241165 RepID=UPI00351A781F